MAEHVVLLDAGGGKELVIDWHKGEERDGDYSHEGEISKSLPGTTRISS